MRHDLQSFTRFIAATIILSAALVACGGGGGNNTPPPAGPVVMVSGRITFDRVPFKPVLNSGLNPSAPLRSPVRQVVVEAIDASSNAILTSTTTDAAGDYLMTVPAGRNLFVRAKAQMLRTGAAPTWNFSVRNNFNSDALYALDGAPFDSGSANSTHNLHAATGWGVTSYTATRAAAPFAILDTVYRAKELILTAAANAAFPELNLFWSVENRPAAPFCPDDGNIGTSSYVVFGTPPDDVDECARPGASGVYILGNFTAGDTDEFDAHVIAHEFGHYLEDRFSRSDSIGGDHGGGDRLDLRVAFGEGWGNAFSAMTQDDAVYRDSDQGVNSDGGFNLEIDSEDAEGWFSEFSVGEILWDVFDPATESGDAAALGFGPIYSVMTGQQISTDALTSIFTFTDALRSQNSAASNAVGDLLFDEDIFGNGSFGQAETNSGNDASADPGVLPIYREILLATPVNICMRVPFGDGNKLGFSRFFRFENLTTRTIVLRAEGAVDPINPSSVPAVDPDIYVYRQGAEVVSGFVETTPVQTTAPATFAPGVYIVEVHDFQLSGASEPPHCMNVSISGS